ncbi:hypothetical protein TNCV_4255751 [Trichonephila clavipes]|nr:hypothetical protein TNCV_4255751 [Trichonephila clavipes]
MVEVFNSIVGNTGFSFRRLNNTINCYPCASILFSQFRNSLFTVFQKKNIHNGIKQVRHVAVIYDLQHIDGPKEHDRKHTKQWIRHQCFSDQNLKCWCFMFEVIQKKDASKGMKHVKQLAVKHNLQHIDDAKKQGRKCTKQRTQHCQKLIYQKRMSSKKIRQ